MRAWMTVLAGLWLVGLALSAQMLRTTSASVEVGKKTAAIRRAAVAPPQRPRKMARPALRPNAPTSERVPPAGDPPPLAPIQGLRLIGTSVQQDPRESLAVFEEGDARSVTTYGAGHAVQGWTLVEIARSHVLLEAQGHQHRLELEAMPPDAAAQASANPLGGWQAVAQRVFRRDDLTPEAKALMKSAITATGDNERRVDRRKVWAAVKDNPLQVMREASMAPAFEGFRLIGVKLVTVPDDGILRQGGFQSGDVIQSVNGESMSDPASAMKLPALLQQATSVDVQLLRDGRATTLTYRLQ